MSEERCPCDGFEADPDSGELEPQCYCGHAQDEHDQRGVCLMVVEL
jgi:hypothetical protein